MWRFDPRNNSKEDLQQILRICVVVGLLCGVNFALYLNELIEAIKAPAPEWEPWYFWFQTLGAVVAALGGLTAWHFGFNAFKCIFLESRQVKKTWNEHQ